MPRRIRQSESKYIEIISLRDHPLNHYKMKTWVTSYNEDGNAFIQSIISVPGNILIFFLLSHSEETTQEDFSTDIYKAYEPNKSKYKSLPKTCISHQRKKELNIGKLSLLILKTNSKLWKFWKKNIAEWQMCVLYEIYKRWQLLGESLIYI